MLLLHVALCKKFVKRLKCSLCNGIFLSSACTTRIWIFALRATFIKIFYSDGVFIRKMLGTRYGPGFSDSRDTMIIFSDSRDHFSILRTRIGSLKHLKNTLVMMTSIVKLHWIPRIERGRIAEIQGRQAMLLRHCT